MGAQTVNNYQLGDRSDACENARLDMIFHRSPKTSGCAGGPPAAHAAQQAVQLAPRLRSVKMAAELHHCRPNRTSWISIFSKYPSPLF